MSSLVYELTNIKTDFEKGYADLELHNVDSKEIKPIDFSMLVMPRECNGRSIFSRYFKMAAFVLLVLVLYIVALVYFVGLATFGYDLYHFIVCH